MLKIEHLDQYYGGSHILRDVSLDVAGAACTVLLGRNGVGKTTLLKGIMGLVGPRGDGPHEGGHDHRRRPPAGTARLKASATGDHAATCRRAAGTGGDSGCAAVSSMAPSVPFP